jgi:PAS domain S-box-containing protein
MSEQSTPFSGRGPLRVLLVGSKRAAAEIHEELRRGGYQPSSAFVENEEALTRTLDGDDFDVAICEDGTGAFGGPAALRQIKRNRPELPVIVVSSLFGESIAAAAMKAGADDFIAKGYMARLVPAVEREVRAAQMRRGWEQAAHGLREAEARSDAFMNNSPTVAFLKDDEGRLVYVNRGFEEVFGARFQDVSGKLDSELLAEDIAAEVRANDLAVLEANRPLQFEERVPSPEGERFWLVSKFPFADGSGRRFVGGVAVDITERKKAEDALRTSEDLFRDLMEHSQALICVHDLDGRILTANAAAGANLGYDWGVDLGGDVQRLQDILAPESLRRFDRYLTTMRETGIASGIMTVLTRTGERRHWEYRNALRTEGVERPVVRGIAIDVTDRVRAERALQETRQFSEQIIASAGEGIIVYGPDLRYLLWNPFMEELTGLPSEAVIGKNPAGLFPTVREDGTLQLLERALAGEKVSADDLPFLVPSTGRSGRISSTFSPHRNPDGTIVGVIGIVEDVTEQKRAEETLRESQASLERAQAAGQIGSWI